MRSWVPEHGAKSAPPKVNSLHPEDSIYFVARSPFLALFRPESTERVAAKQIEVIAADLNAAAPLP